ncbi:MAG: hypothetical protein FH751_00705 [Firmicutes bacterium]|nr:hypothetical protein [Bacillota bacterium]
MTLITIKGIKIKINIFFIILLAIYIYIGYFIDICIILFSLIIHEISHIVMAVKKGVKIDEICLLPFGGFIKLKSFISENPKKEILTCIMGPLSNLIIAIIFIIINECFVSVYMVEYIIRINLFLFILNMLPILPLDGGRIIRGILSYNIGIKLATKVIMILTYIISSLTMVYGSLNILKNNEGIYIILLGVYIVIAARKEKDLAAFIFIKQILTKKEKILKKGVMKAHFLVGLKSVTIKSILDNFLPGKYHIIIVIDNSGTQLGTINEEELIKGAMELGIYVTLEKLLINKKK